MQVSTILYEAVLLAITVICSFYSSLEPGVLVR
jgi:hypothetical protein